MITGRRVFIQSVIALCITASALLFMFPLRTALRSVVETRIADVYMQAEEMISGYIEYESMSPRLFNRIEIRGVVLSSAPGFVSADALTIRYPLAEMLSGALKLSSMTLDISNLRADFDLDKEFPLIEPMFDFSRINVHVDTADIVISSGPHRVRNILYRGEFYILPEDPEVTFSFESSRHVLSGEYSGTFSNSRRFAASYRDQSVSMQFPSFSADIDGYAAVKDIPILASADSSSVSASIDTDSISVLFKYSLTEQLIEVSASSDQLNIEDLVQVHLESDLTDVIKSIREMSFSASAALSMQDHLELLSYSAEFRLPEFTYEDVSLTYLQGKLTGDSDILRFDTVQGRIQDIPVRFRGMFHLKDLTPEGTLNVRLPENISDTPITVLLSASGPMQVSAEFAHDNFHIAGTIDYSDFESLEIHPAVTFLNRTYQVPFLIEPANRFASSLPGSDVSFTLDINSKALQVIAHFNRLMVPADLEGHSSVPVSARIVGSIASAEDYRLLIQSLAVHELPFAENTSVSLKASVTPGFASVSEIIYRDSTDQIAGSGSFSYSLEQRSLLGGDISFREGDELYKLTLRNYDGFYHGTAEVSNGSIRRFPFFSEAGTVDGTLTVYGVLGTLSADVNLSVSDLEYRETVYQAELSASLDPQGITVADSSLIYENIMLQHIRGRYDFQSGLFELSADLEFDTGDDVIVSTLASAGAMLPTVESYLDLTRFQTFLEETVIDLRLSQVMLGETMLSELMNFELQLSGENIMLRGGDEEELFFLSIDSQRREFTISLHEGLPLQLDAEGTWEGRGMFTFHAENVVFDISFLNILQIPVIDFTYGTARGYLTVTGNIQDPDFYGELMVDEAVIGLDFIPEPLKTFNVMMSVHGKEMNFSQFNTLVGNIPVRTKLDFYIEKWVPQYFFMDFSVPQNKQIPSSYTFTEPQIFYDGKVSGNLSLEIQGFHTHVTGDLVLDDAVVSMVTVEHIPLGEEILTTGDLRITTGRSVQFILPTRDLPVMTANIDANQSVRIVFHSQRQTFSVTGNLGIKSGEIYYIRRNFYITGGNIRLAETEQQMDPMVSVRAKIREYDQQANRIDIFLVADNQRISNLTPRFESNPSLPLNEIARILGDSILISEQEGARGGVSPAFAFVSLATDIINQFGLIDQLTFINDFDTRIRNALGLDVFSIRTQLIHNVMLANLTDYQVNVNPIAAVLENTTMFIGKYLGDSMFFQTMLVLSENDPGEPGLFVLQELKMDMELSFEWQTPLYELVISTQPRFGIPGLFSDFSVGLSWNYSF